MTDFAARQVALGDAVIDYLEAGSGATVVVVHGAGGRRVDSQVWEALAARYHLLAPSLPGFDASTAGQTTTLEDVADVLADFIRQTASEGSASVIGESFGGAISSWLAIRHPDVVQRLVLAAPGGLRQEGGPQLSELTPGEISVLLFGRPPSEPPTPERTERAGRNRQHVARLMHGRSAFDPELYEQLGQIRAPTLIVWGTADQMILPEQGRIFEQRIPDARLVLLEGGPHALAAAVPEQFLEPVLEFLGAQTAAIRAR